MSINLLKTIILISDYVYEWLNIILSRADNNIRTVYKKQKQKNSC